MVWIWSSNKCVLERNEPFASSIMVSLKWSCNRLSEDCWVDNNCESARGIPSVGSDNDGIVIVNDFKRLLGGNSRFASEMEVRIVERPFSMNAAMRLVPRW